MASPGIAVADGREALSADRQAVTLAAAVALVFALLGGEAVNVIASIRLSTPLLLAVAAWLLAAPIAGWGDAAEAGWARWGSE